ncbi:hypothetical protein CGRA01v4_09141 [Colletotrichum graminicola]|nr:hypothetical protein CGRA01v4_09141 [Colletotrichum graminicola]
MPSRSVVLEKVYRASLQPTRLSTKLRHGLICPWTCLLGPLACFWQQPLASGQARQGGKLSAVLPAIVQVSGRGGLFLPLENHHTAID